ncbi:MAG: CehA/McbA family metallohydrolase [Planctomycetes bacterium]|nr:CehA/McbA family metallohydrolase [Planctomycetota bacterium]
MKSTEMAQLHLTVTDDSGNASPFRVEWTLDGLTSRYWNETGIMDLALPARPLSVLIRRGIHYAAVMLNLDLAAGESIAHEVVLRRRFDPVAMGWYGGENHMHVLHSPADKSMTICDGARMALAEGLDYIQLAYAWEEHFQWLHPQELNRMCAAAARDGLAVTWNVEAPKSYYNEHEEGNNLHCFGHGWTMGITDISKGKNFFSNGPAFEVIREIHRQGGITGCTHPSRIWLAQGKLESNRASELPFDFVAGDPYDSIDIFNDSPLLFFQNERLWYNLLNMGYKVAGTASTDGCLGDTCGVGRYRTYTKIDGAFSWQSLASGIRRGCNVATSGPFVVFEIDDQEPGGEFAADAHAREVRIKAWSSPLPGETLTAVQLVRNGDVIKAWDLRQENLREWQTSFGISEDEFAWYAVRVLSACKDPHSLALWGPHVQEQAVANPIYFLPIGFRRPASTKAHVRIQISDDHGKPLAASVTIHDCGDFLMKEQITQSGHLALAIPATASLLIEASGYRQVVRNLFMDSPDLIDYCRDIGPVWPSFYTCEPFRELRRRLGGLRMDIQMQPA